MAAFVFKQAESKKGVVLWKRQSVRAVKDKQRHVCAAYGPRGLAVQVKRGSCVGAYFEYSYILVELSS